MCDKCLETCNLIGELLQQEGGKLTIYTSNADFSGDNSRVDFKLDYGSDEKMYFGDTVLDCLKQAKKEHKIG